MTSHESTTTTARSTTPAPFADDDPRARFARAIALEIAVADRVDPSQYELPTPCDGFDVQELLTHMGGTIPKLIALGTGANPFDIQPVVPSDGVSWADAWTTAAHELAELWSDDALLTTAMSLPWVQTDGAGILDHYTAEVSVHTWDLAAATGQQPEWDPTVLELALEVYRHALPAEGRVESFTAISAQMPEHLRQPNPPFGEAVAPADGAPLIEQVIAWTGRDPRWAPA